ncbi:hypothetical protein [Thalassolituus hydrocarboniclasticus]|uniref:Uncharacterized protein n=1 Tax=Thalassolituus hydrocarboniclasticus TaxID=2742796 RepID=A0ABY6ABE2_9GAMM|nr:hypothetical protein [Thalassolituus hydrocarboniclasticus]UXD87967.1 hypothetical protein HUF19_11225 [Thalassolituus hydrocarboniclasticus]
MAGTLRAALRALSFVSDKAVMPALCGRRSQRINTAIAAQILAALSLFVTDFGQKDAESVVQTINTCKRVELTA